MSSTSTGPDTDTGLSALLSAVVTRDGATADLTTRPDGREGCETHTSRCYSRKVDPVALADGAAVELPSPFELLARDGLHPLRLPEGVWTFSGGRDLGVARPFNKH